MDKIIVMSEETKEYVNALKGMQDGYAKMCEILESKNVDTKQFEIPWEAVLETAWERYGDLSREIFTRSDYEQV